MSEPILLDLRQIDGIPSLLIVDVRLPEDFSAAHLPKAKNNCVFEVAFLERMAAIAPDKTGPICVYGEAQDTHEARMAAEKLRRTGYVEVYEMRAGLAGWREAKLPIEAGTQPPAPPSIAEGERRIDLKESRVEWIGRNLLNKHHGSIGLKSGVLRFQNGQVTGGEFVIDMTKMHSDDLAGNPLHDVLIAHLQSDDFFDVALYPEARFIIRETEPLHEATPGTPNLTIHGELSLKNQMQPLTFTAMAGITPEGKAAAQAVVCFDRTQWNVLYGSGRFFRRLGGHLVNDLIEVHLRIVTE